MKSDQNARPLRFGSDPPPVGSLRSVKGTPIESPSSSFTVDAATSYVSGSRWMKS